MGVKLRIAAGQPGEQFKQETFVYARVLQQAKHVLCVTYVLTREGLARPGGEHAEDQRMRRATGGMPLRDRPIQPQWIMRQTSALDPQDPGILHQEVQHHWMQVQVQVPVHMVELLEEAFRENGIDPDGKRVFVLGCTYA